MKRYLLLSLILLGLFTSKVSANVNLEQYLSIINQTFTSTESAKPTDNRLGLIYWDQDVYNAETVYFEAVIKCDTCSGGNSQATATLYTQGGASVTNANVSTQASGYTLVRTSDITTYLSDNTNYTVRLSLDATSGTAGIIAARLVVVQSATTITETQTQLELGSAGSTVNTNYTLPANPKIIRYESTNYAPTPTISFEASIVSTAADKTAYAALSNSSTCASTVSGSEVSLLGTTWTRSRSSSFSLATGTYYVCIKAESGAQTSIANAKLILNQSASGGIAKVRTHLPTHTTPLSDSDSTYSSGGATLTYTPGNFTGAHFDFFYNSVLQTSGGTAYSQLYNTTNSTAITNSEVATTETAYIHLISSPITSSLPSSTKTLDTQLKNSSTNTTTASGSWITVVMTAYPSLSFSVGAVPASTTTNGITTSVASENNKLDFGYLLTSTPKYIAHQLTASTNAVSGYTVFMKLLNTLQGNYPANIIEEFPSTWGTPTTWTEPTGTTANVNTGWIGANTSDTRVSGWGSGSGLFGPIGTTNHIVMQSTGLDSGTSIYVTYAIEVNQHQPTDTYAGTLVYSILPTY